ncbi:hypothetical protein AX14_011916 [Amanita brunnescens Koide BX004]|nr:hypothetical protein AX14_011916 [Amanita brunnescens Koide BX004]
MYRPSIHLRAFCPILVPEITAGWLLSVTRERHALYVSSTDSDISMQSNFSNRTMSTDSEASVAVMLTQSVSTLSDVSLRTDGEGGLLPPSNNSSREGSMESVRSVMSINDIIKPEQHKSVQQMLLDIQAHSTPSLVHLATKSLAWLSRQDPTTRQLPSPSRIDPAKRMDSHRLLASMLECVAGDRPKRYVAAAIITCGRDMDEFIRLANTWFGLFMWPFRENTQRTVVSPSDAATPTAQITATLMA